MPMRVMRALGLLSVIASAALNHSARGEDMAALGSLRLTLPSGWEVIQSAVAADGTELLNLRKSGDTITIYRRLNTGYSLGSFASSDAKTVVASSQRKYRALTWNRMATSKTSALPASAYVSHFSIEARGNTYHGVSRASTLDRAQQNADDLLNGASLVLSTGTKPYSLTDSEYTGKKYYLGWGAAGSGDPSNMHNEVKYDVLHTNAVFSSNAGGNYLSDTLIGYNNATASAVRSAWSQIKGNIGSEDMYLQYSSGHGYEEGLGIGISYQEIRDNALSYPAKEIVIFLMACHSGGLVNSFNSKKSIWQNWLSQGRSLLVMTSSDVNTNSSTGPGKDPGEPGGPSGSAGSAFGFALWKAITGSADGYTDGVVDGLISLAEIREYTRYRTKKVGGHYPVDTGAYYPEVVMNQVPTKAYLATLEGGTERMSDDQIEDAIRKLDAELAVAPKSQSTAVRRK